MQAAVPELVFAECVHVARRAVRTGAVGRGDAAEVIRAVSELPLSVHSNRALASTAFARAFVGGLSGYYAFYLVLAEALDATLVTADRRLAEAYDRVELLG